MWPTLIEYLFNIRPLSFKTFGIGIIISIVLALVFGFGAGIVKTKIPILYRKTLKKAQNFALLYGFITLGLYFLREQRIPYLSARIILWAWLIIFILTSSYFIYNEWARIPERRKRLLESGKQKKYFDN